MSNRPDLMAALRRDDAGFAQRSLPAAAERRILAEIDAHASGRRRDLRRWPVALTSAAAGALAVAALFWLRSPGDGEHKREPRVARPDPGSGFAVQSETCSTARLEGAIQLDGFCRVRLAALGVVLTTRSGTRVAKTPDGVRVVRGNAEFEVAPVAPGHPPFRVLVDGGAIEVMGTRFIVDQRDGSGHVDLLDGKIRFVHPDGSVTNIQPGARFGWLPAASVAPAVAPADEPLAAAPPPAPKPAIRRDPPRPDPAPTIERIRALRAERRYREAASLIEQLETQRWDARTGEILSYEHGDILEHLGDPSAACKHWRTHLARFPRGDYRNAAERALADLACE